MRKILHVIRVSLFSFTVIPILLLSFPVIAKEVGILYPWETTSGNVWKTFGDDRVQPQYICASETLIPKKMDKN